MNLQPDNLTTSYIDLHKPMPNLYASLSPQCDNVHPRFRSHVAAEYGSKMILAGIAFFLVASGIVGYALAMWR